MLKANYDILFGRNTSKHVRCEVISCDQDIHNLGQTQTCQEHHPCFDNSHYAKPKVWKQSKRACLMILKCQLYDTNFIESKKYI